MASTARGLICAGDVYINPKDPATGLYRGWLGPLEASKFGIKPNSTRKDLKSKSRDNFGNTVASVSLADPPDFSVTLLEPTADNVALMFSGVLTAATSAGATVVDEAVVLKATGGAALSKQNLTAAAAVISNTAGASPTTTYVENTDYRLNRRLGLVTVIAGSALATAVAAAGTAGLTVYADYVSTSITGTRVRGGVQPQITAAFRFDGKNLVDGSPVQVEVYEGVLSPSTEFDFLGDSWAEIALAGTMTIPVGKTEAFTVDFRDAS